MPHLLYWIFLACFLFLHLTGFNWSVCSLGRKWNWCLNCEQGFHIMKRSCMSCHSGAPRHRHSHTCYRIITPRLLHFLSLLLLGSSVQPEHCGLDRNADKLSSGTRWMNCYETWKYFWPLTVINKIVEGKEEDMLFLNLMCISSSSCCCRSFFYSVLFISYNKGQQVRSVNNAVGCEHWNWIPIKRRLLFSLVYNCMV